MTSRREFLQSALASGLCLSALQGPALGASGGGGYIALVCVMLFGGMDSQDCLIPTGAQPYAAWRAARTSLLDGEDRPTREREALISLGNKGQGFGFVPELAGLAELYQRGELAVVANAGPLVQPTSKRDIVDGRAVLPPRLASHNDQRSIWETMAAEGAGTGWGGRMIDELSVGSDLASISLQRSAAFVVGNSSPGVTVAASGVKLPFGVGKRRMKAAPGLPALLEEHFRGLGEMPQGYFEQDIVAYQRRAYDATKRLAGLLDKNKTGDTANVEGNRLSAQLAMIAKLISVQKDLGLGRQVFAVRLGGFDTHRNQFGKLPGLQQRLGEALLAFQNTLNAMGVADQVTTFTASDFGRTLVSNPTGTDHGWGGHQFVMGGAVRGGRVIGEIPPYEVGHDLDWRRGAMIPTISIEQYGGALGRWFGLDDSQLSNVFANYGRFDKGAVNLMKG